MNDTEAHAKGQPKEKELKKKTTDDTNSDVKMESQIGEEEHLMKLQKKLTVQDGSAEKRWNTRINSKNLPVTRFKANFLGVTLLVILVEIASDQVCHFLFQFWTSKKLSYVYFELYISDQSIQNNDTEDSVKGQSGGTELKKSITGESNCKGKRELQKSD